jgi:spore coat polysaccharide biosynthesis protein SpsF
MAKVVACIIARTVSKRLPLKILRDLKPGLSMIDFLIQRIKSVDKIDEIYLCTSEESVDDILSDVASRNDIKLYRGSADAVIERMLAVGDIEKADVLIRITGDNPFASIEFINHQLELLENSNLDYVRVVDVPIGATTEVMTTDALKRCYSTMDPSVSEYLMLFLFEPNHFKCGIIKAFNEDYSNYSVTVDTPDDLIRTKGILELLYQQGLNFKLSDLITVYNNSNVKLPAMKISSGGNIKYPYDKIITFDEFSNDMHRRKENSTMIKLYE